MSHSKLISLLPFSHGSLLLLLLLLAGCGESGTLTQVDNTPLQLTLTPSEVVMNNHDTVRMEVGQRLPDGRVIPLDVPVVWASSSPTVANVNGVGLLQARLPGEVTVKATTQWGEVSARVTILPVSADLSLEVTDHLRVAAGSEEPHELRARIVDSAGRPVPGVRVDFSIEGQSVSLAPASRSTGSDGYASTQVQVGSQASEFDLLVSSPGLQVPAAGAAVPGNDGPSASSTPPGQLRKQVRLEVSPSHPASLEVVPGNSHMAQGDERSFAAVIQDEFGNTIETDDVKWRTGNSGVATVSSAGRVKAVGGGSTDVTAEYREGRHRVEGAAPVTVASIEAEPEPEPEPKSEPETESEPESEPEPESKPETESEPKQEPVTDDQGEAVSLHVSAPRTSLTSLGETVQLAVEARDSDGNVVVAPSLNWTSSDTNVVSVNSSGRVIANAVGTALIAVVVACCTGDQVSISVTQEVASVDVSPSSASMEAGSTRQFTAEARDANGNPIPAVSFEWSSTQQAVASVNSSGVVSALADGSAGIRAEASGRTGEASVSVGSTSIGTTGSSPFPNEPAGYVTRFNDGFDYPGVSLNDPWFEI
ncbi:MAG: hypothetical protein EA421_16720, partial [Gemmatimonadales bacterium]